MSLAVPASLSLGSTASSNFVPNGAIYNIGGYWVRPAHMEPKSSEPHVPLAPTFYAPVVVEKVDECDEDDYGKLTKDLGKLSPPLEIITKAHEKLGDNIALAFSGPEDVTSMESWLTGCLVSVFIDAVEVALLRNALKGVRPMEGSSDGFFGCPPLIMMIMRKAKLYPSSCTELGLLSSSNMLLLPQSCAW
ncbi:5'-adenylylsulfate reductase 1, chloroplastic-like [Alnus glutinosa]|uniref:5'-adenylylsulfate reductase 1, chloroplastic-like n=1 Tax=Alnus glutinosa TaxID=3517 RepID=UPI002D778147|nr:5'-adenylylsulfate reductase 1, chloroplastic-like [Alnus glutinosa]